MIGLDVLDGVQGITNQRPVSLVVEVGEGNTLRPISLLLRIVQDYPAANLIVEDGA
jgi:hypothetical protein